MTRIHKFGLLVAMVIASASVVSSARGQRSIQKLPDTGAEVEKILPGGFKMESRPIDFNQERIDLTLGTAEFIRTPMPKTY
jgi:hypothetical protein